MRESKKPFIIGAIVCVALFGIGATLLAMTGGGTAPPVTPSAIPTPSATAGTPTTAPDKDAVNSSEGNTVVELRFAGDCEGCLVTAAQTSDAAGEQQQTATITDSVAQVEVPTPQTYGMYFEVRGTTGGVENGSRQLLLLQPDDTKPGTEVTATDIDKVDQAGACWAGTTLDTAVLRTRVTAENGEVSAAWADPALPTVGKSVKANKAASATPDCG